MSSRRALERVQNGLVQDARMLELFIAILFILWLLGYFVMSMGSFIHILLVLAIIAIIMRLIRGSRRIV